MSIEKVKSASEALLSDFDDVRRLEESGRSADAAAAARDQADADAVQLARVLKGELERGAIRGPAAEALVEKVERLGDGDTPDNASDDDGRSALRADIEQATKTLSETLERRERD